MNRRYFIKSGGIALASFGLMTSTPTFLRRTLADTLDQSHRRPPQDADRYLSARRG